MNYEPTKDLEQLIAEEKRIIAEEHLLEAWDAGLVDGIETEIIAAAFARSLMRKLGREKGDEAVSKLIHELRTMNESGDFIPGKSLQ